MSLTIDIAHRFTNADSGFALNVAFEAPRGVTALFGRSGAGKTTVVNALAGLLRPTSGRITLNGRVLFDSAAGIFIPPHHRKIGYVFQDARLFPHLSVRANLLYGRRFWSLARRAERGAHSAAGGAQNPQALFAHIVALLDLEPLLPRSPQALSGGERQRTAIGRALLAHPDMLLMDEPLAALDLARREEILPYLERLRDEIGLPILYVSHALEEITRLATTLVVLEGGAVTRAGPLAQVLGDPRVAAGLPRSQAGALVTGRITAHDYDDHLSEVEVAGGTLWLPQIKAACGATLRLRIFVDDVIVAKHAPEGLSALNSLRAQVRDLHPAPHNGTVMVRLDVGGETLLARITLRSSRALELSCGDTVYAIIKTASLEQSA